MPRLEEALEMNEAASPSALIAREKIGFCECEKWEIVGLGSSVGLVKSSGSNTGTLLACSNKKCPAYGAVIVKEH